MHQDKWIIQLFRQRRGTYCNFQCSFSTEPRIVHFILCEISDDICYQMSISNIFKNSKEILHTFNLQVPFQRGFKTCPLLIHEPIADTFNVNWQNVKKRVGYSANLEDYYNMNTAITMTMYLLIAAQEFFHCAIAQVLFHFVRPGLVHIRLIEQV